MTRDPMCSKDYWGKYLRAWLPISASSGNCEIFYFKRTLAL